MNEDLKQAIEQLARVFRQNDLPSPDVLAYLDPVDAVTVSEALGVNTLALAEKVSEKRLEIVAFTYAFKTGLETR